MGKKEREQQGTAQKNSPALPSLSGNQPNMGKNVLTVPRVQDQGRGWPPWSGQQDIQPLSVGSCSCSALSDAEREMRGARRPASGLTNAPSITSGMETIVTASSGSVQHRFGRNQHLFPPATAEESRWAGGLQRMQEAERVHWTGAKE